MSSGFQLHVDVTVRNPLAQRYVEGTRNSTNTDGMACDVAWQEKQARYPPKDGLTCRVAAAEVLGRLSPQFVELLEELAVLAAANDRLLGKPHVSWKRKWMSTLSVTLARSAAQTLVEASGSVCMPI